MTSALTATANLSLVLIMMASFPRYFRGWAAPHPASRIAPPGVWTVKPKASGLELGEVLVAVEGLGIAEGVAVGDGAAVDDLADGELDLLAAEGVGDVADGDELGGDVTRGAVPADGGLDRLD
jgi:hypothetical protein